MVPDDAPRDAAQRRRLRQMQRRLEALDRADAAARAAGRDPYDEWLQRHREVAAGGVAGLPPVRSGSGWGRLRTVLVIVLVIVLPLATVAWFGGMLPGRDAGPPTDAPTPGREVADTPLGPPAPAPAGPDSYDFVAYQPDGREPVRWDPCRPIHYATNGLVPPEGQEILAASFARLAEVTGFTFVNDGPTGEVPRLDRAPYQPDVYGDRWAPVLIAWTTPEVIGDLAGATVGLGGAIAVTSGRASHAYVSGLLFLDRPQVERQLAHIDDEQLMRERRVQLRAIILHELGHLFGLGHVDDPDQLMYPVARGAVTDYGVGDLRGLSVLASGPCQPGL